MADPAPKRLSAREELAALTHERIMNGLAVLLRRGEGEVTFAAVAEETGVPERTLYRYFASKEALFSAFWTWFGQKMEMPPKPTNLGQVVNHITALFAAFDREEPLVRAMLHDPHARAVRTANAQAQRSEFKSALRPLIVRLPPGDGRQLLAAVTTLCSASGWAAMKDSTGLSGKAAAEATEWAVRVLISEARRQSRGP